MSRTPIRGVVGGLAIILAVSCSGAENEKIVAEQEVIPPSQLGVPASDITVADAFTSTNAVEEIVALTNICRAIISLADQRTSDEFKLIVAKSGYVSDPSEVQNVHGAKSQALEYFEKDAFDTQFGIGWTGSQQRCFTLIKDFRGTPSLEDIKTQFLKEGWQRSGIVGSQTQKPQEAIMSVDEQGNQIVAVLEDDADPAASIAVGITVSSVKF